MKKHKDLETENKRLLTFYEALARNLNKSIDRQSKTLAEVNYLIAHFKDKNPHLAERPTQKK